MVERPPCARCGDRVINLAEETAVGYAAATAVDGSVEVPEGHLTALHLCSDCEKILRARRLGIHGWVYPDPGAKKGP